MVDGGCGYCKVCAVTQCYTLLQLGSGNRCSVYGMSLSWHSCWEFDHKQLALGDVMAVFTRAHGGS